MSRWSTSKDKTTGLTDNEEALVQRRVNPETRTESIGESYRAVTGSKGTDRSCNRVGFEMLARPDVHARLMALQQTIIAKAEDSLQITTERVLRERAKIAFFNVERVLEWDGETVTVKPSSDLSVDDMAAIESVVQHVDSKGNPVSVEIKFYNKLDALKAIAVQMGYDVQKTENKNLNLNMTLADLIALAQGGSQESGETRLT